MDAFVKETMNDPVKRRKFLAYLSSKPQHAKALEQYRQMVLQDSAKLKASKATTVPPVQKPQSSGLIVRPIVQQSDMSNAQNPPQSVTTPHQYRRGDQSGTYGYRRAIDFSDDERPSRPSWESVSGEHKSLIDFATTIARHFDTNVHQNSQYSFRVIKSMAQQAGVGHLIPKNYHPKKSDDPITRSKLGTLIQRMNEEHVDRLDQTTVDPTQKAMINADEVTDIFKSVLQTYDSNVSKQKAVSNQLNQLSAIAVPAAAVQVPQSASAVPSAISKNLSVLNRVNLKEWHEALQKPNQPRFGKALSSMFDTAGKPTAAYSISKAIISSVYKSRGPLSADVAKRVMWSAIVKDPASASISSQLTAEIGPDDGKHIDFDDALFQKESSLAEIEKEVDDAMNSPAGSSVAPPPPTPPPAPSSSTGSSLGSAPAPSPVHVFATPAKPSNPQASALLGSSAMSLNSNSSSPSSFSPQSLYNLAGIGTPASSSTATNNP